MIASDNASSLAKTARTDARRWSRVRQAYRAGELVQQTPTLHSASKRPARRNALADISTAATNDSASCQKHQYHQLAERVRELQQEVTPDLLLYPLGSMYSPFSSMTPSSNSSSGNLPTFQHQQSTTSPTGSTPAQRFGLSSRILERAHQIPERFWIDWQQKQMQDRIEELEYIKSNLGCSPGSLSLTNDMDDNAADLPGVDSRMRHDEMRRRSILYLQEAQRLANERRTSLARATTFDEPIPENNVETSSVYDNDNDSSFSFDQRSDATIDGENLSEYDELPSRPMLPAVSVQQSPPIRDRSRLTISLPFTYTNTREQINFPTNYRQMSTQPTLEKVVEVSDDATQTSSPTNSIEDVAEIETEYNLTLLKREAPQQISPLLYTKAIVHRNVEFHKFRPIASVHSTKSSKKDITIPIPIHIRKEFISHRPSSPTLSFVSVRSRLSSLTDDDDIQSISVTAPSLSISSRSQSTPSLPILSTSLHHSDHLKSRSLSSSPVTSESSMLTERPQSSSHSCYSMTSFEDGDSVPFSPSISASRHHCASERKEKGNSSYLPLISTSSSQNNFTCLRDSFRATKEHNTHNNRTYQKRTLKPAHNTSIISSRSTSHWQQHNDRFRRGALVNDNSEHVIRSSSSSTSSSPSAASTAAAAAAGAVVVDCLLQRQRRKQTRLQRKAGSEKRNEKKEKRKKKERNKKSPLSTSSVEATEASLFQFSTLGRPTIDTSVIFYPYEQLRCAERSTAKEEFCFPIQTTAEHQKQESRLNWTMADGQTTDTPHSHPKRRENVRVFVRRRRRATQHRKRTFLHSSSSSNSHETIPPTPSNLEELTTLIQQQIHNKHDKSRKNKNIIVVNYKPVFINSPQQKTPSPPKAPSTSTTKPNILPTDDDFSSATHYSRRRSLTTTSSDGSPRRSTTTTSRVPNEPSVSLDLPDVEDPLMFIEMMYQQLFTEDGRLRSGTEPTVLANCVKQIVRNSRRNSISSSAANGSTTSLSKHVNVAGNHHHQQQRNLSSPFHPVVPSVSSSPQLLPNSRYRSNSEEEEEENDEEEEEPNTLVQVNQQRPTIVINADTSASCKPTNTANHSQIHAFLNSHQQKQSTVHRSITASNGFRFSLDDTDNEDFDTFSDLNSMRFNHKPIGTSPSVEEDLTHTDSRFLSSSGYHSLDRSSKFFQPTRPRLCKSHSENDLLYSLYQTSPRTRCIHYCPECIHPPIVTVIPPVPVPVSSPSILQRLQLPVGEMVMKYLNFILISKNVLLLPLFIFLLRQRSIRIGN